MTISMSFAQSTAAASTDVKCKTTKECAAKMGLTTEECKKLCKKVCASKTEGTASVGSDSQVAAASVSSEITEDSNSKEKACTKNLEACAKAHGMTVEECKAKCLKSKCTASSDGESKVAAASATSELAEDAKAKTCDKSKKACCKKKS